MKKTTINAILMMLIALMSVSICFLIFCIVTRPRYTAVVETENAIITEAVPDNVQLAGNVETAGNIPAPAAESKANDIMRGKTSTRVNIRNAASADAKVLDTVEGGTTFEILEIQDNGWTKILYNEEEAYISSDYVIIVKENE